MSASESLTATGLPYDARRARQLLIVLAGMALMVTYVETMVLPAFNQFYTFFHLSSTASFSTVAWILSAYLLVGTVVVPVFGKLGDLYGKKRMLLIAMSIYAVAVTIAGFTPNIGAFFGVARPNQIYLLIAVRGIQGIGMGMFPLAFAMIPEAFPASRVAQGQSVVGAMFAAGAALGLAGGGWTAQTFGWQFTYHTVVPLAVILVGLGAVLLKESPVHGNPVFDLPGVASLGFGLATLLIGVTEGAYWGWTSLTAVHFGALPWGTPEFFLLALVGFGFFAYWEPRAKSPVIRFEALKPRNIFVSNVNGIIVGALMFFAFTTAVILAELPIGPGLGVSEFTFGLLALPSALSMLACAPLIGLAVSRVGPKPVTLLGYGLMAFGGLALLEFNRTTLELAAFMIPLLVGNVATLIAMSNMIVLSVDRRELGIQTGMNQTFRNLGTAIAPVVTTSVLASFTATFYVDHVVPVTSYSITGFRAVFAIVAGLAVIGFLFSLTLRNYRFAADGTRQGDRQGAPAAAPAASEVAPRPTVQPAETASR